MYCDFHFWFACKIRVFLLHTFWLFADLLAYDDYFWTIFSLKQQHQFFDLPIVLCWPCWVLGGSYWFTWELTCFFGSPSQVSKSIYWIIDDVLLDNFFYLYIWLVLYININHWYWIGPGFFLKHIGSLLRGLWDT